MFKRKLLALDYHSCEDFNYKDDSQFRQLVLWLEDQKIRHYKIEEREGLRNSSNEDWPKHFTKYVEDIGCQVNTTDRSTLTDWFLGYAVRLEYGDNLESFKKVSAANASAPSKTQSTNPLDDLDFNSADFKAGVASLATLLQIPPHHDHLTVLKAICILVREKFNKETVETIKKKKVPTAKQMTLESFELGFETTDYISTEAAKILRLLHIKELRDLQNLANEAIVAVQTITADPKTDTKLGKVGKG